MQSHGGFKTIQTSPMLIKRGVFFVRAVSAAGLSPVGPHDTLRIFEGPRQKPRLFGGPKQNLQTAMLISHMLWKLQVNLARCRREIWDCTHA